jgi:hypothetical protein
VPSTVGGEPVTIEVTGHAMLLSVAGMVGVGALRN